MNFFFQWNLTLFVIYDIINNNKKWKMVCFLNERNDENLQEGMAKCSNYSFALFAKSI